MGLFDRDKYFGSGVALPLGEFVGEGPSLLDALVRGILREEDTVETILNYKKNKVTVDLQGFIKYGESTYGLPKMEMSTKALDQYSPIGSDITSSFRPYPIVSLRNNEEFLVRSETNEIYTQGKEALKYLNLDINGTMDSLAKNADIDSVNDAAIGLNIPLLAEEQEAKKYLYHFFSKLQGHSLFDLTRWEPNIVTECTPQGDPSKPPVCVDKDLHALKEYNYINYTAGEFKVSIAYFYIDSVVKDEVGTVGTFSTKYVLRPDIKVVGESNYSGNDPSYRPPTYYYNNCDFIITYQDTPTTQIELTVKGLQHRTYIHRKAKIDPVTLQDLHDDPELSENFFIPLDAVTVDTYFTELEKDLLGKRALTLNINALEHVKLKWYQTPAFGFFLRALSLVVAFFTQQWWLLGINFALEMLIPVLTNLIGTEGVMILQLAYAIVSLGQNIANTIVQGIQITAQNLIILASSITSQMANILSQATNLYLSYEIQELAEDSDEFDKAVEDKIAELEAARLLGPDRTPFNYIGRPYFDPTETPDGFYNRTLEGASNLDVLYSLVSDFADSQLQLPEFKGTLTTDSNYSLNI